MLQSIPDHDHIEAILRGVASGRPFGHSAGVQIPVLQNLVFMSSIPLGVVHRHALGDITAKVELRSVQVPHGHLPSHVSTGDIRNGLQLGILIEELGEASDPIEGALHITSQATSRVRSQFLNPTAPGLSRINFIKPMGCLGCICHELRTWLHHEAVLAAIAVVQRGDLGDHRGGRDCRDHLGLHRDHLGLHRGHRGHRHGHRGHRQRWHGHHGHRGRHWQRHVQHGTSQLVPEVPEVTERCTSGARSQSGQSDHKGHEV
mmetsp:Transcript_41419/g.89807  ORF Transcript_41419/g.89807 Transcript_41419/m.89807 type:complete len:260 (-) Transcript_41419:112-891(-)